MTFSSYYELRIRGSNDRSLFEGRHDARKVEPSHFPPLHVAATQAFAITLKRWSTNAAGARLRLRLGDEVIADISAESPQFETSTVPWLRNEFGESSIVLEMEQDEEGAPYRVLMIVDLMINPRPEVLHDFQIMIEDLAAIHEGLAYDVLGRGYARRGRDEQDVARLQPRLVVEKLRELRDHLKLALEQIAKQPSVRLDWSTRLVRYRGGDRIGPQAVAEAVREPATRIDAQGRVLALGRIRARNPVVSEDLPEHRHIAEGLRRLASRSYSMARHCRRSASSLAQEKHKWGGARPAGGPTVFEQRDLPRIEALESLALDADTLGQDFEHLLQSYDFLRDVGPPRTSLAPTPVFLGRTAYREVYRALIESNKSLGLLVDEDAVRIAYRDLPTLYEYWCFLRTISYLGQRFTLADSQNLFSLVDDIYRPELKPGQEFRFEAEWGVTLIVTYVPEFYPLYRAERQHARYAAALTRDPLRPDITIEIQQQDKRPVILVLDAKSTDDFRVGKFREMTNYSQQVFEIATGWQPIRQVVLLHRTRNANPVANLPNYFRDPRIPVESHLLAAISCVPDRGQTTPPWLEFVIDQFLALHAKIPLSSHVTRSPRPLNPVFPPAALGGVGAVSSPGSKPNAPAPSASKT